MGQSGNNKVVNVLVCYTIESARKRERERERERDDDDECYMLKCLGFKLSALGSLLSEVVVE